MKSTETRAEFLLMMLVAVAIIGLLAGILAPVLSNQLDDAQIRTERGNLKSLRQDFEGTYDALDYGNLNESALPGSGLPAGITFTTFDQGDTFANRLYALTLALDPAGWVTKLAQRRGLALDAAGTVYSSATGNQYVDLAFNHYRLQRCLLVGPTNENGRQRYLLLSLMAPADRGLVFPTADPTQTFNTLWDQNWDAVGAQAPASWSALLNPGQYAAWNAVASNRRTNASRLLLERIVQAKYTVTLANNSLTDTAWVDLGPATNAIVAAPNSGTTSSAGVSGFATGVLAGRQIVVRRGASAAVASEVQRFFLYADVTLTVQ
jgi:type II secretory pathway pseudopilin PulG